MRCHSPAAIAMAFLFCHAGSVFAAVVEAPFCQCPGSIVSQWSSGSSSHGPCGKPTAAHLATSGAVAKSSFQGIAQPNTHIGADVNVVSFSFSPTPVVIQLNDTVVWHWISSLHSVTSVEGSAEVFDSGDITAPSIFSHTFTHLGDFAYYCDLHGSDLGNGHATGMAGIVRVVAIPEPSMAMMLIAASVLVMLARKQRRNSYYRG